MQVVTIAANDSVLKVFLAALVSTCCISCYSIVIPMPSPPGFQYFFVYRIEKLREPVGGQGYTHARMHYCLHKFKGLVRVREPN